MLKFIENCLEILPTTLKDYYLLSRYHYRTEPVKPATQVYKICGNLKYRKSFPDPIGVIVYRQPIPDIRARTKSTKEFFHKPSTTIERLKLVNKKIQYIARLIVDPRFHKMGLGSWLLEDSLERQLVPIVETLTPIDFTNKIFQKAGFKLYQTQAPARYNRFINSLLSIGLSEQSLSIPFAVQARLESLSPKQTTFIENEIQRFIKTFHRNTDMPPGLERTSFLLSKIPYPQAYLIWFNPRNPIIF